MFPSFLCVFSRRPVCFPAESHFTKPTTHDGSLHDVAVVVPSDDSLVLSRLVGGGVAKPI